MSEPYGEITKEEFEAGRDIRMAQANPERMQNPFWEKMVRSKADPFWVGEHFGKEFDLDLDRRRPIWCFSRIGQSATMLRNHLGTVFIGGEHEEYYDPEFAIYNDVVIRRFDGSIEIYGYPRDAFQPTDFHTATLVEGKIYIIGGLGYPDDRIIGTTPIYRLDLETMQIDNIPVNGPEPGWIFKHEALYWKDKHSMVVWGGNIFTEDRKIGVNKQMWAFDLDLHTWKAIDSISLTKSASPWFFDPRPRKRRKPPAG